MTDPYCVQTIKRPLSRRGLGHVTEFKWEQGAEPPEPPHFNHWKNPLTLLECNGSKLFSVNDETDADAYVAVGVGIAPQLSLMNSW